MSMVTPTNTERFRVEQKDINESTTNREFVKGYVACNDCPVATVIRRAHPNWQVGAHWIVPESGVYIELPEEVVEFINHFDLCQPVKPITFALRY